MRELQLAIDRRDHHIETLNSFLNASNRDLGAIAVLVGAKEEHESTKESVRLFVESRRNALAGVARIAQEMISGKVQVSPAKAACQIYGRMILEALKLDKIT